MKRAVIVAALALAGCGSSSPMPPAIDARVDGDRAVAVVRSESVAESACAAWQGGAYPSLVDVAQLDLKRPNGDFWLACTKEDR